ncbi:MAG: hypothetical protein NC213_07900 [Acetobacter sp.]|nr:hypothetical protein [Bacteroides sp.]MCM1341653.1 hypothetical protein [Acetobacter sp.]MCM1434027.1 hypothetical protein [Clostridiales bacterium]
MNNENEGKRIALYVNDDILEICEQDLRKSGAKNRSRFICYAVKFYHCYLNKSLTNSVLTPAFESVVDAKLDLTEYRLSQIIFKLAVEMAYTMNILAGAFELEPEKLELMKDRVLYEVKSINGAINLKDIIKYQNGY